MPFKPGQPRPENAGRKKGTPNKATQSIMDKCDAKGLDVFESMIDLALYGTPDIQVTMLKELAQYIAPKRKAIEISTPSEVDVQVEEFKKLPREQQIKLVEQELKRLKGEI